MTAYLELIRCHARQAFIETSCLGSARSLAGLAGIWLTATLLMVPLLATPLHAQSDWEITPESERALDRGLEWLAANQGAEGNWTSNDLGLVSLGALAFMAAGHQPGRGRYAQVVERALDYVMDHAKPSGLLNISNAQRDMYNHGLATFVLGQAHGMTSSRDRRLNQTLDQALKLIANTQCDDGGWEYRAARRPRGHDLSLVVMQAKALRSAVDSGLEVPNEVIQLAIQSVREHYGPENGRRDAPESEQMRIRGQFTYQKTGTGGTLAMAAAGVVCLQEFGQGDDWRIAKNVEIISAEIDRLPNPKDGTLPFDAYTTYYVGQALYQVGGEPWRKGYPRLRDYLIQSQLKDAANITTNGLWRDNGANGGGKVGGRPGDLFGTAIGCLVLALPNRYLPILSEAQTDGR